MMSVTEVYRIVIEETISNSKNDFKKQRIPEDVLQQLQNVCYYFNVAHLYLVMANKTYAFWCS
jgi:hypothetical protein